VACNLSFVIKYGVLKVTGSHVHFKSGSVLKTVLDKDIEQQSKNRKWYALRQYNNGNCDELRCMSSSFIDCKLFLYLQVRRVVLCHSRVSCLPDPNRLAVYPLPVVPVDIALLGRLVNRPTWPNANTKLQCYIQ